jgi:hypothetical protein
MCYTVVGGVCMTVKIAITIDEKILKLTKEQATKEKRSLSNMIVVALEKYLESTAQK